MKRLKRYLPSIFPVLSISLLFLFISCTQSPRQHKDKMIFRYNESAGIVNLDPAFSRDMAHIWVCNQLYNGLVQLDNQLEIQPSIAQSWTISDDGLTYTFYLRQDVFFHSSEVFKGYTRVVNAHDFVYSFNRLLDTKTASPGAWVFTHVRRDSATYAINALNDSVLVIELAEPFPAFLGILAMQYCSVIPKEAVAHFGAEFRKNPVGTGPFYLKNWEENIKMVLQKNENYFEIYQEERLPFLDAISISFLADKMTAFLEFTKGKLDFISGLDASYKDELLNRQGQIREKYRDQFVLKTTPFLNTEYLGILVDTSLATVQNSPLSIKAVRKAINYGFDRQKMIRYLRNGIGTPGTAGIIPKGMPAYRDSTNIGYQYFPDKSRKLLAEAGFNDQNPVPPITLVTTNDYLDICKYVQSQLEEVGITIEIEVAPPAAVIERRAQSRIGFFRASWIADYPDEENYLSLFYSGNFAPSGPNYTHFANTMFDGLYRQSVGETDRYRRTALYHTMDSIVMEHAPVVILYYDQSIRCVSRKVEGLYSNPVNQLDLRRVRKIN